MGAKKNFVLDTNVILHDYKGSFRKIYVCPSVND
jgi:predicted ribonuclease YlaK